MIPLDATRREAIGRLIGDLGEIQARLLHLVLGERKPDALTNAVDDLEAAVENLRKAASGEP